MTFTLSPSALYTDAQSVGVSMVYSFCSSSVNNLKTEETPYYDYFHQTLQIPHNHKPSHLHKPTSWRVCKSLTALGNEHNMGCIDTTYPT